MIDNIKTFYATNPLENFTGRIYGGAASIQQYLDILNSHITNREFATDILTDVALY